MSKPSARSSSPTKKKAKVSSDQPRIDQFFSSPKKSSALERRTREVFGSAKALSGKPNGMSAPDVAREAIEVIDVDSEEESNSLAILRSPTTKSSSSDMGDALGAPSSMGLTTQATHISYRSLSCDPLTFTPEHRLWQVSSPVPYAFLAHALSEVSKTRSRISILNILTNAFRTVIFYHPPSLLPSVYLLSNCLSPPYEPIELGIGSSVISKAIQHISGLTPAALRQLYTSTGDAGDVAFEAKLKLRTLAPHPPLLVPSVYTSLLKITQCKGQGAASQKQKIIEKLLVAAKGEEVRFLVRTLAQNLRVGAVKLSIMTALARAMVLTPCHELPGSTLDSRFHKIFEMLPKVQPLNDKGRSSTLDSVREEVIKKFKASEEIIRQVFVQHPNYDHIVAALLDVGLDGLAARVPLTVGIPLHPTLGSPARSLSEVYDQLGEHPFTAEFKYDGQRAQIHAQRLDSGSVTVHLFSRHLEDMTSKYPDVVSLFNTMLQSSPSVHSCIIDSEIVAIDANDGSLKTFQELSNRARKDVQIQEVKVSVGVFAFDLMYFNGEILLGKSFRERRTLLRSEFPPFLPPIPQHKGSARFEHVESCESQDGKEAVEEFWQKAVGSHCEGLMIKLLDNDHSGIDAEKGKSRRKAIPATYEPDKRTSAWLKLKKDYVSGLADSLDLIPIGAWHGNGRKASWWSPILLGVWDASSHQVVAVCKCMSGFTDAFYKALNERYQLLETSDVCSRRPIWECDFGGFRPDVYFKPQEVWEIRGADITISPISVAALGLVSSSKGLSLRFPRFIRIRGDKGIEQASTPQFLANMWTDQQTRQKPCGFDGEELIDVELSESEVYFNDSGIDGESGIV